MSEESNLLDILNLLTSILDEMINKVKDVENKMDRLGHLFQEMGILAKKNNPSVLSLINLIGQSKDTNESEFIEKFNQFNENEKLIGFKMIEVIFKSSLMSKNFDEKKQKKAKYWFEKLISLLQ